MAEPYLVVFAGAPGMGKSTLARAVARELRAAYLDKDTIKDAAIGLGREMKVENAQQFAGALSYTLLIPLARDSLTVGAHVVVDSPAGYRAFQDAIEQLVRSIKVDFRLVECITTDETLLRERAERRAPDLPDRRVRDFDAYQQARERLERMSGPRLVIDTAEPMSINLRKIMNALGLSVAEDSATVTAESASSPGAGAEGAVDQKKTENR